LPSVVIPDLGLMIDHAAYAGVAALAIVMIGFSQSTGDARAFATKHRYRVDINQESLAQGAANIGAGLFQGIPVSTSLSASSLNDNSGAKSQLASLVTGGVVILTMLAFAPLFSELPTPVLGAVIIDAVIMGMIDVPELQRMFHVKQSDFWISIATIVGVLLAGVLAGIVIGVILSVGWLVRTVTSPAMPVLGREPGTHVFREVELYPDDEQLPGLLVLGLDGDLFFATAEAVGDRLRKLALASQPPPTTIVLDCRSVFQIDSQGSAQVREMLDFARVNGIALHLARVKPQVLDVLMRDALVDEIGAANIHESLNDAVQTHLTLSRLPAA
ncbi:MAG TPA: SulP family inorganic anion transporter, partial [Thermomicrobiales bacterium]|nr:SulP family inorganic anion transporter [Thermomicrobiales bacterium]